MRLRAASITPEPFSQEQVMNFMVHVSVQTYKDQKRATETPGKKIDFDDPSMKDVDYTVLTGLRKFQFDELLECLDLRSTDTWSDRNSLGLLLTRIRTGRHHPNSDCSFNHLLFFDARPSRCL